MKIETELRFLDNLKNYKSKEFFWDELEEAQFKEEIILLREEFINYVETEAFLEEKEYVAFDESEADDMELMDNFSYGVDLHVFSNNYLFIYNIKEKFFFFFFFLFYFFLVFFY